MGKLIVEQIVSLDGYAEDAQGSIDFFVNAGWVNEVDQEQLRLLSGVSAIVLGARTYRMFAAYWPSADPAREPVAVTIRELPKFVVSSTLKEAPWGADDVAEILAGDGVAALRQLRRRFAGDLIIWGSLSLSDALLRAGEVDVLRLRVLPLLLGRGRSFAPADLGLRSLALRSTRSFAGGLLVLEYAPAR
ncbi:dihydrofolate reductase family protein [Roseateles violae]|uniref:Dihydrofolate reductase family protein n=1 Tax=Roseateles violae TaxID=3058042 RepID=A0ABT8DXJ6_9BURK|nr:dihydrofolate reductase family protein [Pelomonas sp. PFR6]MDN3922200.1 dihydrofolate reductase family protein [Pelomonas sp. PFR6]